MFKITATNSLVYQRLQGKVIKVSSSRELEITIKANPPST